MSPVTLGGLGGNAKWGVLLKVTQFRSNIAVTDSMALDSQSSVFPTTPEQREESLSCQTHGAPVKLQEPVDRAMLG